jgi:hypothetical protein
LLPDEFTGNKRDRFGFKYISFVFENVMDF